MEVIQRSTDFLARRGVESPRLQTELLLAHVLRVPRLQLYLSFQRKLTEAELEVARELVRRRGGREPLQQLVGSTCFCGLELAVDRRVMAPRPETELLAEKGWQFLQARAAGGSVPPAALDFGTGSGCLAIALAVNCPAARLVAVDVSADAISVARTNAARHGLGQRIQFLEGDGFAAVPKDARFDLIVSNPPYIPSDEISGLEPEVRDFDPRLALDGGPDGLAFYRRLAGEGGAFLRAGGRLMAEFGDGQAEQAAGVFSAHNWIVERIEPDYAGRARCLVAALKSSATGR